MFFFFFYCDGYHRDLHGLTHSFPTRRSSDLASPRKIIRGQVHEVLATYPEKIKALEASVAAEAPLRAELRKIISSDAEFGIEENFFGLQPFIRVNIRKDRKSTRLNSSH